MSEYDNGDVSYSDTGVISRWTMLEDGLTFQRQEVPCDFFCDFDNFLDLTDSYSSTAKFRYLQKIKVAKKKKKKLVASFTAQHRSSSHLPDQTDILLVLWVHISSITTCFNTSQSLTHVQHSKQTHGLRLLVNLGA